jgi:Phytanoyl-CoA dioxygenase (PhyH)
VLQANTVVGVDSRDECDAGRAWSSIAEPFPSGSAAFRAAWLQSVESQTARFSRQGYLSINSLTTVDDIAHIRSLLDPLFAKFDLLGERAADIAAPRIEGVPPRSPEINEAIKLAPRLRNTLAYSRCREIARKLLGVPVGYSFDHAIYKPPHNGAATDWHQDEAYSAQAIPLRSVHFWIPLQEATVRNGCMWFVPGSNQGGMLPHHVSVHRTAGPDQTAAGTTITTSRVGTTSAVACPLTVGSATVHHPLTLHYTGANESDEYRRVWILHFAAYGRLRSLIHPLMIASRMRAWLRSR